MRSTSILIVLSELLLVATLLLPSATSNALRRLDDDSAATESLMAGTPIAPPPCTTEEGVDYVGNDITSVTSPVSECCRLCRYTNGCNAWTWSNLNGGTCWLKSAKGQTASNPNVRSGVLRGSNTCPVTSDTDFIGNDVGRAASTYAGGCCDLCRAFPGCGAFSWTNFNGGMCWLKSYRGQTSWSPGVQSGVVGDTPPPTCTLEWGIDYVGNDVGNTPASRPGDCCSLCKVSDGCRAFTWSSHNGGTCWFKSAKGATVGKDGVVSSDVSPVTCKIQDGVDFVDNDIGHAPSADAQGCCGICAAYTGCKVFAWTNQDGGTCWLKSAQGQSVNNANVKAGTIG